MSSTRIIENTALPQQEIKPLSPGANNIFESGMKAQQNEANLQLSLVGGIRRYKKKRKSRRIKGGATSVSPPVVVAPSPPSYDPTPKTTGGNFAELTELALGTKNNATFDNAQSQAQVASLSAQQQAVYEGKGGKKMWSSKKGGSFPIWGCLSGGKSRKHKKTSRYKRKHRKTRKHVKKYRR